MNFEESYPYIIVNNISDKVSLVDLQIFFGGERSVKNVIVEKTWSLLPDQPEASHARITFRTYEKACIAVTIAHGQLLYNLQVKIDFPLAFLDIPDKQKVYVANIPEYMEKEEIRSVFQEYGRVINLSIIREDYMFGNEVQSFRRSVLVNYSHPDEANQAIAELNDTTLHKWDAKPIKVSLNPCNQLIEPINPLNFCGHYYSFNNSPRSAADVLRPYPSRSNRMIFNEYVSDIENIVPNPPLDLYGERSFSAGVADPSTSRINSFQSQTSSDNSPVFLSFDEFLKPQRQNDF